MFSPIKNAGIQHRAGHRRVRSGVGWRLPGLLRIRIAAEAGLSIDTVKKYLKREGRVTSTTEDRMRRALEALKIQAPDATEPAVREEAAR